MTEIPTATEMAMVQDAKLIAQINQTLAEKFVAQRVDTVSTLIEAPQYVTQAASIWQSKGYEVTVEDEMITVTIPADVREAIKEHLSSD